MDRLQIIRDSIALDAAYLSRSVPAVIDSLAAQSAAEVQNARERAERNARGADDAPVVPSEDR